VSEPGGFWGVVFSGSLAALGAQLTEYDQAFKAGDLLRHPALKLFIGALEERPHDRMGRAIAEQCVGVRRVDGWPQRDRITACRYRQTREGF
jgi:hypothetical protein